jgi:hypothetical protein
MPELESHVEEPPAAIAEAHVVEETPAAAEEASVVEAPVAEAPPASTALVEPALAAWVPPPTHPPPGASTAGTPGAAATARPSSSVALGIVLVVLGLFFLVVRLADIDLSTYGWPLYVIIPGLTLLVVGFASLGTGAAIPGGIVTMTGLVLAYQNTSGDWASWSYAWALVVPGGVGIGIFTQGLRDRNPKQLRQGRSLMFWSALLFMIGFVVFESILDVSGIDYGVFGRAALPALLIVIGVTLLARSFRRGRIAGSAKS